MGKNRQAVTLGELLDSGPVRVYMRMLPRGALVHGRGTLVVADGFSCRKQIADGTRSKAMRLAHVLAAALRSSH